MSQMLYDEKKDWRISTKPDAIRRLTWEGSYWVGDDGPQPLSRTPRHWMTEATGIRSPTTARRWRRRRKLAPNDRIIYANQLVDSIDSHMTIRGIVYSKVRQTPHRSFQLRRVAPKSVSGGRNGTGTARTDSEVESREGTRNHLAVTQVKRSVFGAGNEE